MIQKKQINKANEGEIRIFLVEDHPIFRNGLADLINQELDMVVCGHAEDAPEAITTIKKLKPDAVVTDITLKETSGLDLIKDIKTQCPNTPVLTLSMHDESHYAERALRAGAKGYITKQEAPGKVVMAIREILSGKVYLSAKMTAKMLGNFVGHESEVGTSQIDSLSNRELEVYLLIGQGFGVSQIAEKLFLSTKTVETYRAHIKEKLNLANAGELRQHAIQWMISRDKG
jgi:DNA-binding NarL/FixJ family response regulator